MDLFFRNVIGKDQCNKILQEQTNYMYGYHCRIESLNFNPNHSNLTSLFNFTGDREDLYTLQK